MKKIFYAVYGKFWYLIGRLEVIFIELPKAIIWALKWKKQHPELPDEEFEKQFELYTERLIAEWQ